jgi:hypothetical protein
MKVKALSTVKYNGAIYEVEQEFEVDKMSAKSLVEAGVVKEVKEVKKAVKVEEKK